MFLDVGAGGETDGFSDFQLLQPAWMQKVATTDNQYGAPNAPLRLKPAVLVRDLGGEPVAGATVRFDATGNCDDDTGVEAVSNALGIAEAPWTLSATPGPNSRTVCGRGIAAADPNNGPRATVDPWQPLSTAFGDCPAGGPLLVGTGTETFSASRRYVRCPGERAR